MTLMSEGLMGAISMRSDTSSAAGGPASGCASTAGWGGGHARSRCACVGLVGLGCILLYCLQTPVNELNTRNHEAKVP